MEANELRIGNYVSMTRKKYDESFLVVCEIRKKFAVCKYPNELDDEWSYKSDIYPIPLTEDWLVKFGFENKYKVHYFSKTLQNETRDDIRSYIASNPDGFYLAFDEVEKDGNLIEDERDIKLPVNTSTNSKTSILH